MKQFMGVRFEDVLDSKTKELVLLGASATPTHSPPAVNRTKSAAPALSSTLMRPLVALVNDMVSLSTDIVFILDDYHVIDSPIVRQMLAFMVDNAPPPLRLVILSRVDPPLALAQLLARGQLLELRPPDLRFNRAETALFLNEVMGLNLTATDLKTLEARTEGWIAGLQLAALSLQGCEPAQISHFLVSFSGGHRYVLDLSAHAPTRAEEVTGSASAERPANRVGARSIGLFPRRVWRKDSTFRTFGTGDPPLTSPSAPATLCIPCATGSSPAKPSRPANQPSPLVSAAAGDSFPSRPCWARHWRWRDAGAIRRSSVSRNSNCAAA